jgi:acetyltransferase-like isoleucine patch superfamily enzyme
MGQMHVQRAVQSPNPPKLIVATDIDAERLQSVADRFGADAISRGVDLVILNPKTMDSAAFDAELRRLTNGRGYDDIVSLVPVAALIEHADAFLADGGWFNIFAGENLFVNFGAVFLDCAPIRIGRNAFLAPGVHLYTATHPTDAVERVSGREFARPITIGDDVWLGGGVIVCPGVTIGDRCVIGAGSVVTKNIPAGVVAAGNPCRVLRQA